MDPALRDELFKLTVAERIQLAEDLWESVAPHQGAVELTEAQARELERRLRKAQADPSSGVDWEDLRAELTEP